MDFRDEFPAFCSIRTSLKTYQIDPNWVRNILLLVLGTHLNHTDINDTKNFLTRMESDGFRFITVGNTPETDILTGNGDKDTNVLAAQTGKSFRVVPIVMPDPLGCTGMLRFCFFF